MARRLLKNSKCEYENCNTWAIDIVYSRRKREVMLCCEVHTTVVVDETDPEYSHTCENCGCMLPIN